MIVNREGLSLKAKILFLVGMLTGIILVAAFVLFSFQSRKMIIRHLKQSCESVTRAFSVFVMDAMIKDANGLDAMENVLGHYMLEFIEKNPKIIAIEVIDERGQIIAGNGPEMIQSLEYEPFMDWKTEFPETFIQKNHRAEWVATVFFPLRTGSRKWGTLIMHFNANREHHEVVNLFWMMLLLTGSLVLAVLLLMGFFLNRVTQSLGMLKKEMDQFDPESEDYLTPIEGKDEIGVLFNHFNDLKRRLLQSRQDFLKAQKQVYHAEKLASIGRFASGMAHEINNPLNGIQSCLYAIKKEPENYEQTQEYLELATEGLAHIEMVVRKLLGFARKQSPSLAMVDLKKEAQTVLGLLDYKLNKELVDVNLKCEPSLPAIQGDPHLIQELLMNLVLNSFDAVVERGEQEQSSFSGKIQIKLRRIGDHLEIEVYDNGPGIPEGQMEHLFDPFYTTKDQGKGTGLGLSVALGIAQAYGGSIVVKSWHKTDPIPDSGERGGSFSEFLVCLPLEVKHESPAS